MSVKSTSLIRKTPTDALLLKVVRTGDDANQGQVENDHKRLEDWDREYVSFGGYFGIYDPEVFAAAPELLEALKMMWDSSCTNATSTPSKAAFLAARAAINKATGR